MTAFTDGGRPTLTRTALIAAATFLLTAVAAAPLAARQQQAGAAAAPNQPVITFVELGSVKCVPCKMMQPVMESIRKKYGGQVRIVFHDVWTDSGKAEAQPYRIRAIPTQVFLDRRGNEIFRHEGFLPESEIDTLLRKQGLNVIPPPPK